MNLILAAPLAILGRRFPWVRHVAFMDDRSFSAEHLDAIDQVLTLWRPFSKQLGLKENEQKTQIFCRRRDGHREIANHPDLHRYVKPHLIALGTTFSGARKAPGGKDRQCFAAVKARCLPHGPLRRRHFSSLTVSTKAVFGWILRPPPLYLTKPLEVQIRAVGRKNDKGSSTVILVTCASLVVLRRSLRCTVGSVIVNPIRTIGTWKEGSLLESRASSKGTIGGVVNLGFGNMRRWMSSLTFECSLWFPWISFSITFASRGGGSCGAIFLPLLGKRLLPWEVGSTLNHGCRWPVVWARNPFIMQHFWQEASLALPG